MKIKNTKKDTCERYRNLSEEEKEKNAKKDLKKISKFNWRGKTKKVSVSS